MECVIETKASLQFIDGLRGNLRVTLEEGTSARTGLLMEGPEWNKPLDTAET
jgi:hypothetical protein